MKRLARLLPFVPSDETLDAIQSAAKAMSAAGNLIWNLGQVGENLVEILRPEDEEWSEARAERKSKGSAWTEGRKW